MGYKVQFLKTLGAKHKKPYKLWAPKAKWPSFYPFSGKQLCRYKGIKDNWSLQEKELFQFFKCCCLKWMKVWTNWGGQLLTRVFCGTCYLREWCSFWDAIYRNERNCIRETAPLLYVKSLWWRIGEFLQVKTKIIANIKLWRSFPFLRIMHSVAKLQPNIGESWMKGNLGFLES